jgi:hypothetical protein
MTNLYLALFLIFFEVFPEALADSGRKTFAGVLEFIYRACVAVALFGIVAGFQWNLGTMDYFWYHIGGYVLLRYCLLDIIYNLINELPIGYIGKTKFWDKVYGRVMAKVPVGFILFSKAIFAFMAIVFLIK